MTFEAKKSVCFDRVNERVNVSTCFFSSAYAVDSTSFFLLTFYYTDIERERETEEDASRLIIIIFINIAFDQRRRKEKLEIKYHK